MNVLQMIKDQRKRQNSLSQAQFLMSKTYRGSDYTSAHSSPATLNRSERVYRGVGYIK